jgi:hypothetical protein
MWRKRSLLVFLAVWLVGVVVCWILTRPREPSYDGRRLSQWLAIAAERAGVAESGEEAKAIRAIGTNAIPYLLKWMEYKRPWWRVELEHLQVVRNYPVPASILEDTKDDLADSAWLGFQILGREAETAIPELTRIVTTANPAAHQRMPRWRGFSSQRAMFALQGIGGKAFLPVVFAMTNQPWGVLHYALSDTEWIRNCATELGTNARPVLPVLVQCLQHPDPYDPEAWVATWAAEILCELRLEPGLVAQSVRPCLEHPDGRVRYLAASVLEVLRPEAPPEVRLLFSLGAPGTQSSWRADITNQLRAIAPQALSNVLQAAEAPIR